jgi:hypothetical protein
MTKLLLFGSYAFRSSCWVDRAEQIRALIASDVERDIQSGAASFHDERPTRRIRFTQRLTRLLGGVPTEPIAAVE